MDGEISTKDLYKLIQGLVIKCEAIQTQNTEIKEELKQEIRNNRTEISDELSKVKQENENLREENNILKKRITAVERKLKKYNLIIYGLEEKNTEVEDVEQFLDIVNNKVGIDCRYSDIRDIYRLGKNTEGKRRPVLVEFTNYRLKLELLKNSKKLKGTGIYLVHDYIPEDYEKQKILRLHLKAARENNHEAIIRNNLLYVNGEKFTYDDLKDRITEQEEAEEEEEDGRENIHVTETQRQPETSQQNIGNTEDSGNSASEDKVLSLFKKPADKKRKLQYADNENPTTKRSTRQTNKL